MPPEDRYTDDQRDAAASAYLDRGIRPAKRILELAAAGELTTADGTQLDPFEMPLPTLRTLISRARKRRTGRAHSETARMTPRDAIEHLRLRYVAAADKLLQDYEAQLRKKTVTADPQRLSQIGRVIREAAALPGPNDPRPVAPGAKQDGQRTGGQTRNAMRDSILSDAMNHTAGKGTAPNAPVHTQDHGSQTTPDLPHGIDDSTNSSAVSEPGALALELDAAVQGRLARS